jgi:hypothetical protein
MVTIVKMAMEVILAVKSAELLSPLTLLLSEDTPQCSLVSI